LLKTSKLRRLVVS